MRKTTMRNAMLLPALACGIAFGDGRPFLAINEDNDRYIISAKREPRLLTAEGARDYFDSVAEGGAVTHFFMCVNGQRTSYASKVWEPIWLGVNDRTENGVTNDPWCVNAKILHDRGIDIWKIWCARAREKGVSPWISMRMNDAHYVDRNYKVHRNESFWWNHPEWWLTPHTMEERTNGCRKAGRALDFAHPEVFDHALKLVEEILDRWDADGIELDWMRQPNCLTRGREMEKSYVLTEFMRRTRRLTEAAAKRRGHPVGICVRLQSVLEGAHLTGYDVEGWAKEGLMDIVVPTSAYCATEYVCGTAEWRAALSGAPHPIRLVFGTDICIYNHAVRRFEVHKDLSFLRGWAANARDGDGLYLFNAPYYHENPRREVYAGALSPERVAHGRRRYPITYHEWMPTKALEDRQFARSVKDGADFHLSAMKYGHDRTIALVMGFDEKCAVAPKVLLNGTAPAADASAVEPSSVVPDPSGYVTNPKGMASAWRWEFPASVMRNGRNDVKVLPVGAAMNAVWCEIAIDGR